MITAEDFQKALVNLVEKILPYSVSFDFVEEPSESYVWIDIKSRKKSWDKVYFQRILEVEIQVILIPNDFGIIKRSELLKIVDKLDAAIMPCVQVKDRFITVQDFNSYIVDEILHYEFALDFTDYVQTDEYEGKGYDLMENLEIVGLGDD